jgi:carbamoyl-phosphate synthase large subunit
VYLIPYPTQGGQAVLERIRAIHQRSPFRVLLPNLDSELTNFIQLQHELDGLGIKMLLPGEEQLAMRSKVRLGEFAHAHGIPFPLSLAIATPEKLDEAIAQLGLPIVVKGCFYEAQVCHTVEHAHTAYWSIANRWGLPVVAQTYMPGEEYDICALGDREGRLSGAVAMRKLRLTDKGKAWAGITIRDAELLELTRQVIEGLDWVGPAEIEFIRSAHDGRFQLFEINPRFPAWCYLTAGAGLNLPARHLKLALGEGVAPSLEYDAGTVFVRHATDIICSLDTLEALTTRGEVIRGQ